jgi:hypothetical protein
MVTALALGCFACGIDKPPFETGTGGSDHPSACGGGAGDGWGGFGVGGMAGTEGGAGGGVGTGGAFGPGLPTGNFFTIIALPDTQYYSSTYPDIFDAQVNWILNQRADRHIAFVLHEGDIVDSDVTAQWENASKSLHKLDGVVPYVLAQGNHDYFILGGIDDRTTMINQYFPVATIATNPGFLESFEPTRVENTAQFLMMGDMKWLVVSLEFGPRDVVLTWADRVLKEHAEVPAMIVTHAYLYWDGTRYDHIARPEQRYNPYLYSVAPAPGTVNDGEDMWKKVVEGNENVEFVISGHVFNDATGDAAAAQTSIHPSGRKVHQIVANYQQTTYGGGGFLRVMEFCPDQGNLRVSTYSPYLNLWKEDAANQFTLPLP